MASLENIIFTELETENIKDVIIAEGFLPMSPMLAYLTLKRNSLKNLQKVTDATVGKADKAIKGAKIKAVVGREKLRAEIGHAGGKDKDSTVYKLSKKQKEILSQIHEKYGNEIIEEIMSFRKNILAPYQIIKRTVKKNKTLTSAETFGMTKEQFKSSLESGRRKIEARGSKWDKFEDSKEAIEKQEKTIADMKILKAGIRTSKKIPASVQERILKNYDLGKAEFASYSMDDLRRAYFKIRDNVEDIGVIDADDELDSLDKAKKINKLVKQNVQYRRGTIAKRAAAERAENKKSEVASDSGLKEAIEVRKSKTDFTKNKNFRLANGGFNAALGLYFLRRKIMDELKPNRPDSIYRDTYITIVDELIDLANERKKKHFNKISKDKNNVEFNEKERKIWELRASVGAPTGKIKDYIQKLKEEDFFNPKYFKKSDKLVKAEKSVEAGIKRFERNLKKKLSKEDYANLKKYRLINNLITVGELKSPDKLFKSPEELQRSVENKKKAFLSDEEFNRKIKDIASSEYDSISDLNKAKKEAQDLFKDKEEQGDEEITDKMKGVLVQIKDRKSTKPKKIVGNSVAINDDDLIDAGMIEKMIKGMLAKDYDGDDDQLKKDQIRLKKLVKKYKEADGENAERNLDEIEFLFKKLRSKTQTLEYKE